ncbi:hypothetical protein C8F01DRAFT_1234356 [Mycena amicta]|nr:hypothetical protein C8F01DRAFT_1234356 [Mycena amicta]
MDHVKLEYPHDLIPSRPLPYLPLFPPGAGAGSSGSGSSSSRSSPPSRFTEVPVLLAPQIPPPECPLQRLSRDMHGRPCFVDVSRRALRVGHDFTLQIAYHRSDPPARCSHCAEIDSPCDFDGGWGVLCGTCVSLGNKECEFADPTFFHGNLVDFRDRYMEDQWRRAESDMANEGLSPALAHTRYAESIEWFYRGAQGAIDRFNMLRRIVRPLAHRGYRQLADASNDPQYLARCLMHAFEHGLHPSVITILTSRISELAASGQSS